MTYQFVNANDKTATVCPSFEWRT